MRALLDVNLLIAMFQTDHAHYRRAHQWWEANRSEGWASCPLTQNGFVRILSQPKYLQSLSIGAAFDLLRRTMASGDHAFWRDDISLSDPQHFDHARILGPNQLTDIYLLALAVKNGGRLATFDQSISIGAVRGAELRHVVVI